MFNDSDFCSFFSGRHLHRNPAEMRKLRQDAARVLRTAGVAGRCRPVATDFFAQVPRGGDAYLLKSVIQDWDDTLATRILLNCRRALPANGRLLLVEQVAEEDIAALMLRDLLMLATTGGRVRSRAEFETLLERSGFTLARIIDLGSKADYRVLEAVPVPDS